MFSESLVLNLVQFKWPVGLAMRSAKFTEGGGGGEGVGGA